MQRNASIGRAPRDVTGATLLLLFGGVLLGALDIAIIGPALPAIQNELALDSRQIGWIYSIYILFWLIAAPLLASLSDRLGRRRVYIACLSLFGIGSLVVAISVGFPEVLIGRAIQAIGAGGTLPVASAVIADTFPQERRGRALGLIGAVFGLAFVMGPLIGGFFLQWSWRWLFVVNLPLVVVLIGMAINLLDVARPGKLTAFDARGALLLAIGLGALAVGASSLETSSSTWLASWSSPLLAFPSAALALFLFWRVERRAQAPIMQPRLLQSRQMRIVGVLALATGLVEASMVFLPTLAVRALDVSASRASFMLLPLIVALIAGSIIAGRVLDKVGSRPVIQVGIASTTMGLVMFALFPLGTLTFYVSGLTVGFGLSSLLGAPLRYVALQEGGTTERGASQGILTVCLSSGQLFGTSMTSGIAASAAVAVEGYRDAMLVIAIACGAAWMTSFWLRNDRPAAAASSSNEP